MQRSVAKPIHQYLGLPEWMAYVSVKLTSETFGLNGFVYAEALERISEFVLRD
jgi:hypothetical protein